MSKDKGDEHCTLQTTADTREEQGSSRDGDTFSDVGNTDQERQEEDEVGPGCLVSCGVGCLEVRVSVVV